MIERYITVMHVAYIRVTANPSVPTHQNFLMLSILSTMHDDDGFLHTEAQKTAYGFNIFFILSILYVIGFSLGTVFSVFFFCYCFSIMWLIRV